MVTESVKDFPVFSNRGLTPWEISDSLVRELQGQVGVSMGAGAMWSGSKLCLLPTNCVAWGRALPVSGPWFPHLKMGITVLPAPYFFLKMS